MDFISLFALMILISLNFIFSYSIFWNKRPSLKSNNLPPGSNGWLLFGETMEFLSNPEKFITHRMNKYSPKIFKTSLFGEPMVVLCGTDGNKHVAVNEGKIFRVWRPQSLQRLFTSSYQTNASGQVSREEEQHITRAPGFLRHEAVIRYVEGMDCVIQQHLKTHWQGKQTVNLLNEMELMTLSISSHFYLGINTPERILKLAHLFHDISLGLHSIPINFPGTIFYRATKSANALRKELLLIIREKKTAISGGKQMNDILAYMIIHKGHNGEFMSENEICDKIMGLIMAAFISPASSLSFILKFVGERPDVYEKIQEGANILVSCGSLVIIFTEQLEISGSKKSGEALNWQDLQKMKYTWSVSLEVMRLLPPLQGTFREAITDFTYEGFTIPKGWKVYWTVSSTNKNPECFPEPEEFIATRFEKENCPPPYTNIPFGGGPRICPGKEYAQLLFLTILYNVVKSFKWEVLDPNEKIIPGMTHLPEKGIPVRLVSL